jgi:RNA-directed DNA polymerase
MRHETLVVRAVASAMLAEGAWTETELTARGSNVFHKRPRWMAAAATAVLATHPTREGVTVADLVALLSSRPGVMRAIRRAHAVVRRWAIPVVTLVPPRWPVPAFASANALASWLELSPAELTWFADVKGLGRNPQLDEPLRHYRAHWVPKRRGGVRLLEAPKPRLRDMQRRMLREILDAIPPHDAAHGFRRGRDARSHAALHEGQAVVLRLDLEDFFLSVSLTRVVAMFRAAGYADDVAHLLGRLCTHRTNASCPLPVLGAYPTEADLRARRNAERLARTLHLPQGAPTSPAVANLCAYRLDVRMEAAAAAVGATYSRYADDLVFSGGEDFAARAHRFAPFVGGVVLEEGFRVNHRKTRIMGRGARQLVGGLVVNAHAQVPRATFDTVKAIVRNCIQHGPASQNRDGHPDFRAHLRGLVGWAGGAADSPRRAKLDALFRQIVW